MGLTEESHLDKVLEEVRVEAVVGRGVPGEGLGEGRAC